MIEYEWIWTNQWQSHSLRRVVVIRHMYYTWDLVKWLCVFKVTTVLQKSYRNKGGSVEETLTKIQQNLNFLTQNWESGFCFGFCKEENWVPHFKTRHRRAFCQFPFQWIYYYGSNKSTGKETGKTHLCAVLIKMKVVFIIMNWIHYHILYGLSIKFSVRSKHFLKIT